MNFMEQKKLLPHNLPKGELALSKIQKLINTARELGGTLYDVAADSGLLSANHFMEQNFEEQITGEHLFPGDLTVVTEVYVQFPETSKLDRIFLYSDNAEKDIRLLKEGSIRNGKLVIEYDRLELLHAKGYKCIYSRAEDGHNGKAFVYYNNSFGNDKKMLSFHLWDDCFTFVESGFHQALMVRTSLGVEFVMPDVHAVQECMRTIYAENLIREDNRPDFRIERIDMEEEEIQRAVLDRKSGIWESVSSEKYEKLPESYKRLLYQITYIKVHYPRVYEQVWSEEFEPEDETTIINWDELAVSVGICLSDGASYGVCLMQDGTIKRIPNQKLAYDTPLNLKYKFPGYGNILNAGTAGSRMGIIMKEIVKSAENMLRISVNKVAVTHVGELPEHSDIVKLMEGRMKRASQKGTTETDADLIAYAEIADKNMNGLDLINWAANLAELPGFKYVDSVTAMVKAYEGTEENGLKDKEIGLVYDFSQTDFILTLVRMHEGKELEVILRDKIEYPEDYLYEPENDFSPGLDQILGNKIDYFMLNAGLRALGIYGQEEVDREAFDELRRSIPRVKRQFIRNDKAKLFFDNGYVNMMEDYPIEDFAECYIPVLKRNKEFLKEFISKAGIDMEDISKIYLAGEKTEYPFVRESIKSILPKKQCSVNASECVAARGAVLSL